MKFQEFDSRMVRLSEVLNMLDERVEAMTHGLVGSMEVDGETLHQRLGKVQGMNLALKHLVHNYGATQEENF